MKAFYRRYMLAPILTLLGVATVVVFQNCSNDVGFDSDPSGNLTPRAGGQGTGETGPVVGGNGNIVIQINEQPGDSTSDTGAVVDYEIETPNGTITQVDCTLTNTNTGATTNIDCSEQDRVTLPPTGQGPQEFTITATNDRGDTVTETIIWTVYDRLVQKTKDFVVNVSGTQVDIIINVDNSNSMEYEQQSMAQRITNFLTPFAGLDYQIAITTTSPTGGIDSNGVFVWDDSYLNYTEGKFVPMDNNGTFCIKSSVHTQAEAETLLQNNLVRGLDLLSQLGQPIINPNSGQPYAEGNGWERGIYTTYRAFERDIAGQQGDDSCIRDGSVPKHVILISDEDETLAQVDENNSPIHNPPRLLPNQNKSQGSELINYVSSQYGVDTVFRFHSIIVNPYDVQESTQCLAGAGRYAGRRYGQLSVDTGGYIGTVCAPDYSAQLGAIGQLINDSSLTQALECVAVANQSGDFGNVVNLGSGNDIGIGYNFNGNKVDFAQLPGQGNYRITYYCFE